MSTKIAIVIMVFLAIAMIVGVNFAGAQAYTPLVHIPGLPPTGAVNLSMYLVGLYDFLLSIVGIVAVMMLVIGGMRYITAAGNQAAVSDAKDIITNAIAGLLLAILSWVIVAEINPDVLYIKKPGGKFIDTPSVDLGSCYTNYDSTAPAGTECTCKNTPPTILGASSANDCHLKCKNISGVFDSTIALPGHNCTCEDGITTLVAADANNCNSRCREATHCDLPSKGSCVENGRDAGVISEGNCYCADLTQVKPATGVDCETTCKTMGHCAWNFLVVRVNTDDISSETVVGDSYWVLNTDKSQLWDFFLTNRGTWDKFNVTADSYTSGGITYECAILVTARKTTTVPIFGDITGDYHYIFWAASGTKIKKDGFSLKRDLESSGGYVECCGGIASPPACRMNVPIYPGCDGLILIPPAPVAFNMQCAHELFEAKYTDGLIDHCADEKLSTDEEESCRLAASNTMYSPKRDIVCDPTTGMWK